jgi:hypothetical protein
LLLVALEEEGSIECGRYYQQQRCLILQYANPALNCLQSYYDSLVELGRMDDSRLGLHFFEEWRANVLLEAGLPLTPKIKPGAAAPARSIATFKKRRRGGTPVPSQQKLLQQQQQQQQLQ